jgi:hypothetical protein
VNTPSRNPAHRPRVQPAEKLRRATILRDAALEMLRREGNWQTTAGEHCLRLLHYEGTGFLMLHRTPFQQVPVSTKLVKEGFSERFQRELDKQYGLDIWVCGKGKVVNLIWNRNEPLEIVSFKRGSWENDLLTLCSAPPKKTT